MDESSCQKLELHQLVGDGVVENLLGGLLMSESHLAMGQVEHEGCGKLGMNFGSGPRK